MNIFTELCYYDKRNPENCLAGYEEGQKKPRDNCYCDNCFRGLDALALQAIELLKGLENAQSYIYLASFGDLLAQDRLEENKALIKKARGEA